MTEPPGTDDSGAAEIAGTFVVVHADENAAEVRNVETARVHALSSNPGLEAREVLEGTLAPEPPMEVTWRVVDVADRYAIELVDSDLEPTRRSLEAGADAPPGELSRFERAGSGEVHVLSVPGERVDAAAEDVLDDVETVARAARLGATRVEVRRSPEAGVLSVRYLPD